jgi:hypothetical protein
LPGERAKPFHFIFPMQSLIGQYLNSLKPEEKLTDYDLSLVLVDKYPNFMSLSG